MSFKSGRRPVMPISHYFSRYFYGVTRDVNEGKVRRKWAVFDFFPMMPFRLCPTPPAFCLWSSENQIVGVGSKSGRTKSIIKRSMCIVVGLSFRFCFRLRRSGFHKMIIGTVSRVGRNGNVLILLTPIPSRLWLRRLTTPIFDFH